MSEPSTSAPIDIGAVLRQARLKHGQSLDVVHQHTRIPKKFLEAMENNRFDEFPALVYLRGFLKNYCEHFDIEFEPLWNQIAPQKPQADGSPDNGSTQATEPRLQRPSAPAAREHDDEHAGFRIPSLQTALMPLFLLAVLLMGAGLLWIARKAKPAAPPSLPPAPPAAIAPIRAKEKMVLKLRFHKETWVRLHCDGVLRFEGRAPAGFSQEWTAMNDFTLRARTPGDVGLTLDGREVNLTPALQAPSGDYKIGRQ